MTDADIVDRIDQLAHAQQAIYSRHSRADRRDGDAAELRLLKTELDRCWGARRAIRAHRDADRFVDDTYISAGAKEPPRRTRARRR
jgi:hypothetical protein